MRLALISDIHANLEALQQVLEDIQTQYVDHIYCLGDVIGYGCDPVACVELVDRHCEVKLMGNHEYVALGRSPMDNLNSSARDSMIWTRNQLDEKSLERIARYELQLEEGGVRYVHASPFESDNWRYLLSVEEASAAFEVCDEQLVFFGHTHLPMIFSMGAEGNVRFKAGHSFEPDEETRYLVNVGSVGQPRDNDNRACYVVYDQEEQSVSYRRVAYDIARTQEKLIDARMPRLLVERLIAGR